MQRLKHTELVSYCFTQHLQLSRNAEPDLKSCTETQVARIGVWCLKNHTMELFVWFVNILSFHVISQNQFLLLGFETTAACIFPFKAAPFQLRCSTGNWKAQAPDFLESRNLIERLQLHLKI